MSDCFIPYSRYHPARIHACNGLTVRHQHNTALWHFYFVFCVSNICCCYSDSHEHTRPDRDDYVFINYENIEDRRMVQHNFDKSDSETLDSPYDFGSVMHYYGWAFAIEGTQTIVPKNGAEIKRGDRASDLDIMKLKLLYQCEGGMVRLWGDLIENPCTSQCKCREGWSCRSTEDCHEPLVCSSGQCIASTVEATQSPIPSPTPSLRKFLVWQNMPEGESNDFRCVDLRWGDTTNGNYVWYYPCNYTPCKFIVVRRVCLLLLPGQQSHLKTLWPLQLSCGTLTMIQITSGPQSIETSVSLVVEVQLKLALF